MVEDTSAIYWNKLALHTNYSASLHFVSAGDYEPDPEAEKKKKKKKKGEKENGEKKVDKLFEKIKKKKKGKCILNFGV